MASDLKIYEKSFDFYGANRMPISQEINTLIDVTNIFSHKIEEIKIYMKNNEIDYLGADYFQTQHLYTVRNIVDSFILDKPSFLYQDRANLYFSSTCRALNEAIKYLIELERFYLKIKENCIKKDASSSWESDVVDIINVFTFGVLDIETNRNSFLQRLINGGIIFDDFKKHINYFEIQRINFLSQRDEIYHQIPINQRILEEIKIRSVNSYFRDEDTKKAIFERMEMIKLEIKKARKMAKDMTEQHRITEELRIKYAKKMMKLERKLKAQGDKDLYEKMEALKRMMED